MLPDIKTIEDKWIKESQKKINTLVSFFSLSPNKAEEKKKYKNKVENNENADIPLTPQSPKTARHFIRPVILKSPEEIDKKEKQEFEENLEKQKSKDRIHQKHIEEIELDRKERLEEQSRVYLERLKKSKSVKDIEKAKTEDELLNVEYKIHHARARHNDHINNQISSVHMKNILKNKTTTDYTKMLEKEFIDKIESKFFEKDLKTQKLLSKRSADIKDKLKKTIIHNRAKTERQHMNIQSQISNYESKMENLIKKHEDIDHQVELTHKKKEEEIDLKKEINQYRQNQLYQFK